MNNYTTIVVSLGGSLLVPHGVDDDYIKSITSFFIRKIDEDPSLRMVLVCGGGKICRDYIVGAKACGIDSDDSLDNIGIAVTKVNAELVRCAFGSYAYDRLLADPYEYIDAHERILIASGWKPNATTDYVSTLLATTYGAQFVFNLSNIDGVYDKNPYEFSDAVHFDTLSWNDFFGFIGQKRVPGGNYPFDPIASTYAQEKGLFVIVSKGDSFDILEQIISVSKDVVSKDVVDNEIRKKCKNRFTLLY